MGSTSRTFGDVNTDRAHGGGGIKEALEIGRRSGVGVHFSHHRTSAENAGQVAERVALIDQAKNEGVDITLELYPYPTGSSFPLSFLPSYAHEGGPDAIMERLKDADERAKLASYLEDYRRRPLNEDILSYLPQNPHLEGMSLPDIARERGVSSGEALCRPPDRGGRPHRLLGLAAG